jgi:hypothetical protein
MQSSPQYIETNKIHRSTTTYKRSLKSQAALSSTTTQCLNYFAGILPPMHNGKQTQKDLLSHKLAI